MGNKVVLTPLALSDIEDIARHVAADDPSRENRSAIVCSTTPVLSLVCRIAAATFDVGPA